MYIKTMKYSRSTFGNSPLENSTIKNLSINNLTIGDNTLNEERTLFITRIIQPYTVSIYSPNQIRIQNFLADFFNEQDRKIYRLEILDEIYTIDPTLVEVSFFMINETGIPYQGYSYNGRKEIIIANLSHLNKANLDAVYSSQPYQSQNSMNRDLYDYISVKDKSIYIYDGVNIFPELTGRKVNSSGGRTFGSGINLAIDKDTPNIKTINAQTISSLFFYTSYRDGLGGFINGILIMSTTPFPLLYDDNSGILQAIPANKWIIWNCYHNSLTNFWFVAYGQTLYSSLDDAIDNAQNYNPSVPQIVALTFKIRSKIIMKYNALDFSDMSSNAFIQYDGSGTTISVVQAYHSSLINLDYNTAGHLDFQRATQLDNPHQANPTTKNLSLGNLSLDSGTKYMYYNDTQTDLNNHTWQRIISEKNLVSNMNYFSAKARRQEKLTNTYWYLIGQIGVAISGFINMQTNQNENNYLSTLYFDCTNSTTSVIRCRHKFDGSLTLSTFNQIRVYSDANYVYIYALMENTNGESTVFINDYQNFTLIFTQKGNGGDPDDIAGKVLQYNTNTNTPSDIEMMGSIKCYSSGDFNKYFFFDAINKFIDCRLLTFYADCTNYIELIAPYLKCNALFKQKINRKGGSSTQFNTIGSTNYTSENTIFQCGTSPTTLNIPALGSTQQTISFHTAYTYIPIVFHQLIVIDDPSSKKLDVETVVINVTTSNFVIEYFNSHATEQRTVACWYISTGILN